MLRVKWRRARSSELAKHVERIVIQPDKGLYVASGRGNLLGVGRWDGAEGQS
jgi:hypothetical protein